MAYDFKKLSDVDVVETLAEAANVLIEEDGVIKKAPKTKVVEEPDMIIRIDGYGLSDAFTKESISITKGTAADVCQKILTGKIVDVRVRCYYNNDNYVVFQNEIKTNTTYYGGYLYVQWMSESSRRIAYQFISLSPDNTVDTITRRTVSLSQ